MNRVMKLEGVVVTALVAAGFALPNSSASAQADSAATIVAGVVQASQIAELVTISAGNSALINVPGGLARVSVGDPDVADVVVVSDNQVVVIAKEPGTTSVLVWNAANALQLYTIRVVADLAALGAEYSRLFPDEDIQVSAVGNSVVLSGEVRSAVSRRQAVALAETLGEDIQVLDYLGLPDQGQIMLKVRFAEVSRNALEEYGMNLTRVDPMNPRGDDEGALSAGGVVPFTRDFMDGDGPEQTFSDAVNFFLFHDASKFGAFIQALRGNGLFKSLAEPNLLALPGEEATFLAGGEFPFPVVQGSGATTAITVLFKEFGIRLRFVPEITNTGAIRLEVAPEVSALDFANGVQLSGFSIPSLTSRKAETTIELAPGQTFAIAGLADNTLIETLNKVPLLGDIPVLGRLFQSKEMRQNQTELLVLVTPELVQPMDTAPAVPTGEPGTWGLQVDTANASGAANGNGGNGGNGGSDGH